MSEPDENDVTEATREADEEEAGSAHDADRAPTPEEEAAAPTEADPEVAEHFSEMNRIGTEVKGEGAIP